MSNQTANFTLPTKRADGTALAASEIALTRFSLQTGSGPFVQLADVAAPTATTTLTQTLAPGSYVLRGIVVDKQVPPKLSAPLDAAFVVPAVVVALAAPNPLATLTVTVT